MKISELEEEHNQTKYLCITCHKCWCTLCCFENMGINKFDIIDGKIMCSKHRYLEIVYLPNIYKP